MSEVWGVEEVHVGGANTPHRFGVESIRVDIDRAGRGTPPDHGLFQRLVWIHRIDGAA